MKAHNIHDLRAMARRRLPRFLFEFVDRGCEDEVALDNNRVALRRVKLLPRVLNDVSTRDLSIELFGQTLSMPLAVAPAGSAALMWYQGEQAIARAASAAGIPAAINSGASVPMERTFELIGKRAWFQIYMLKDLSASFKVIERAKNAGIEVLVVTVDSAASPIREYNVKNSLTLPFRITPQNSVDVLSHPRWFFGVALRYMASSGLPRYQNAPVGLRDPITGVPTPLLPSASLSWKDLREVRRLWPRILVVKGLLTPEDAVLAADHGADAVVVSNHGGRNLDSAPAAIEMLPSVVDAVGHRMTVLCDSGVRRGSDVVKAVALGAKAVLVGRAPLYAAAAAGEEGVAHALAILRSEIHTTLGLIGCASVRALNRSFVQMSRES